MTSRIRQKQMAPPTPQVTLGRQTPLKQRPVPPPQQRPPQMPQQMQQPPPPTPPPQKKPKMAIGDAIGFITIRLGRVEQFIQQLQTDGIDMTTLNTGQPTEFLDQGLIQNLVSRLNTIEEGGSSTNTYLEERVQKIESDLKDTKDLLIKLMLKFENFSENTLSKFEEQQQQITFNLEQLQQEPQLEQPAEPLPVPSNESEPVPLPVSNN